MSETTPQQRANLARIRDNQRRSRARRKEYLQELETKYRSCEAVGAEASAEIQAAARKVLDENKRLRNLLRQQGFSDVDIDGPEHDEYASSPSAAEMLDVMLVTRKPCRPSSGGGCGDGLVFKTEDEIHVDSRRQSCASAPAASLPLAPQPQQHCPIALAPAPANPPPSRPQSHDPVLHQQHQHHQLLPQQQQQLQHQLPPQIHQSMQFQSSPVQQQQVQAQQQQPFYMAPPSHSSAPPAPLQNAHSSPGAFVQDYPLYAPQPFGYAVPQSQLLDWDLAAAEAVPQPGSYPTPGTFASPTAGYPTAASFASPTPTASTGYNTQDNTSSCYVAADVIRTLHADAGPEIETALGCRDGSRDCRVDNSMVFDLMDRYTGAQGQQGEM